MRERKIAELFAGIGGVTSGFLDAGGYRSVYLGDVDPIARNAFIHNNPSLRDVYQFESVVCVTGTRLLEAADGSLDGLLGCPPCQGFSAVGKRLARDSRNQLLLHMRRLIWSSRPQFFVIENVPQLISSKLYRDFVESLEPRYDIDARVLNAAEYGLPQLRRRAVVIGFGRALGVKPTFPAPTHGGVGSTYDYSSAKMRSVTNSRVRRALGLRSSISEDATQQLVNLEQAWSDLPSAADDWYEAAKYASESNTPFQLLMRKNVKDQFVWNHSNWEHSPDMVKRMRSVRAGRVSVEFGSKSRNERYFSQAYGRLHARGLARTITTNFHNPGSGRFTHYSEHRAISIREALRAQGFPDSFVLPPSLSKCEAERLAGNAFPRLLARHIATHVRCALT